MFSIKRIVLLFSALMLAIPTLGIVVSPALAKEGDATKEMPLTFAQPNILATGKSGVYLPKSAYAGELDLSRVVPADARRDMGIRFVQPLINFQVELTPEKADKYLHGQADIFFDLSGEQYNAWKDGSLAIYSYKAGTKTWVKLPTFSVRMQAGDSPNYRVAARAVDFGIYGLGQAQ